MTEPLQPARFLSWWRSGLATQITEVATGGLAPHDTAAASVSVEIQADGPDGDLTERVPGPDVRLRGPGDVVGIDPGQVVRHDPEPGAADAEPNLFVLVEFAAPDLPWRFTPAAPDGERLQPWIVLVVVEEREGVSLEARPGRLPVLHVDDASAELPDLAQCWAWAHVHAEHDLADGLAAVFAAQPETFRSRLLCPRRLAAGRSWLACVVPAFGAGRDAGLGEPVGTGLGPAWGPESADVRLPVYHSWRFSTGEQGDFESLVRRLTPRELPGGVGRRDLDLSEPGGGLPAEPRTAVAYEGGLVSPAGGPGRWPAEHRAATKAALRERLNRALRRPPVPEPYDALRHDPIVGPPAYAAPQAGRRRVPAEGTPPDWFEQLNTEPHRRTVAGLGAEVVRADQEALMAAAWTHAAGLREANRALTGARFAWEVARFARPAFDRFDDATLVQLASPAMSRLQHPSGGTVRGVVTESALPPGLVSGSFRRRTGTVRGFSTAVSIPGRAGVVRSVPTAAVTGAALADPVGFAAAWADARPPLGTELEGPQPPDVDAPFTGQISTARTRPATDADARAAARAATGYPFPRPVPETHGGLPYEGQVDEVADLARNVRTALDPAGTIVAMIEARVTGLPAQRDHDVPPGLSARPRFTTPMSRRLLALSAEYLVPGVGMIADDTLGLLEVNREFVEAFLAGFNHELGREFAWREYPTRLNATWAQHFWDTGPDGAPDIGVIRGWTRDTPLGDHPAPAASAAADLVLLIKGALPRRYPDLRVYVVQAAWSGGVRRERAGGEARFPLFAGALTRDVSFYGFALGEEDARGSTDPRRDPGWFFVLEEQPRAARFGLDVAQARFRGTAPARWTALSWAHLVDVDDELPDFVDVDGPSWLADAGALPGNGGPGHPDTWGADAATMARITFQRPIRMLVHADSMLPPVAGKTP